MKIEESSPKQDWTYKNFSINSLYLEEFSPKIQDWKIIYCYRHFIFLLNNHTEIVYFLRGILERISTWPFYPSDTIQSLKEHIWISYSTALFLFRILMDPMNVWHVVKNVFSFRNISTKWSCKFGVLFMFVHSIFLISEFHINLKWLEITILHFLFKEITFDVKEVSLSIRKYEQTGNVMSKKKRIAYSEVKSKSGFEHPVVKFCNRGKNDWRSTVYYDFCVRKAPESHLSMRVVSIMYSNHIIYIRKCS